jgi:hypothetical protein
LILLNARNVKNSEFAQVRYTAGTRTVQVEQHQSTSWIRVLLLAP